MTKCRLFPGLTWKRGPCAPRQVNNMQTRQLGWAVVELLDTTSACFLTDPSSHSTMITTVFKPISDVYSQPCIWCPGHFGGTRDQTPPWSITRYVTDDWSVLPEEDIQENGVLLKSGFALSMPARLCCHVAASKPHLLGVCLTNERYAAITRVNRD